MNLLLLNGVTPFQITGEMLKPITDTLNSSLTTMAPIGITVLCAFLGLKFIKRVFFTIV